MKKTLFYVNTTQGCGIRAAFSQSGVMAQMSREVGTDNVKQVRLATQKDVDWVKASFGQVPEGEIEEEKKK